MSVFFFVELQKQLTVFLYNQPKTSLVLCIYTSASFGVARSNWTKLLTKLLQSFVHFSEVIHISGIKILAFRTTRYFKGHFSTNLLVYNSRNFKQSTANTSILRLEILSVFSLSITILLTRKSMSISVFLE